MNEQKLLNVEMRVMFDVPVDENSDIKELSEEGLGELACDYFFNYGGHDEAEYDFEFSLDW